MDLSRGKTSDWLEIVGGLVFFVAGFMAWWTIDLGFASADSNTFDYFFTGIVPWLIFSAIAVLTFLDLLGELDLPPSVPAPLIRLVATAVGTLLVVVRFFSDGVDDDLDVAGLDISRGVGLYVALLAAIVVLVGTIIGFQGADRDQGDAPIESTADSASVADGVPPVPPPPASPPETPPAV